MSKKEITFSCHLIKEDGTTVNFEDLPPDELAKVKRNLGQRMANAMSEYYSQHPDEFASLA